MKDPRLTLFNKVVLLNQVLIDSLSNDPLKKPPTECLLTKLGFLDLIKNSWEVCPLDTFKILLHWRDNLESETHRHWFIFVLSYICKLNPAWIQSNIGCISYYGHHLDLIHLWYYVGKDTKSVILDALIAQLIIDRKLMDRSDSVNQISFLAKSIPNENGKYDRLLAGHPRFCIELCKGLFKIDYVNVRSLKYLRKNYITPLRQKIRIVENTIGKKPLNKIFYQSRSVFLEKTYMNTVEENESFLQPKVIGENEFHALYKFLINEPFGRFYNKSVSDLELQAQWNDLKANVDERCIFEDCIAVTQNSRWMDQVSLRFAHFLSLLMVNPSNGRNIVTFSNVPDLYTVSTGSIQEQVNSLQYIQSSTHLHLGRLLDLLLRVYIHSQKHIKRVFVFSCESYDQTMVGTEGVIDFFRIEYQKHGIHIPQIVFWNLSNETITHPQYTNPETITINGTSEMLLNTVLNSNQLNQLTSMFNIIHDTRYDHVQMP
ncbi:hypothetical protein BC833DRAFT_568327 [Globomyces pollinis-pini]|nr:hypothetical protein BC833DRAFT_568327 [Globomyces pollinis-pini]